MKKYMCPKCRTNEFIRQNDRTGKCLKCNYESDIKSYSKLDMHYKKHIHIKTYKKIEDTPRFIDADVDLIKNYVPINKKIKQHFEARVSAALRTIPNLWYMKIQVNPMAHQPTVADFMILTPNHNIAFECKELDINLNKYIPFSRFTQLSRMLKFKSIMPRNEAFMGILIWENKINSIYIIPATVLDAHMKLAKKKSINYDELQTEFANYKVPLNNLELYFKKYFL